MENSNIKKDMFYKLLIAIAIVIPIIIGFSYAYIMASVSGIDNPTSLNGTAITSFNFSLNTVNDGYIDATNLVPLEPNQVSTFAPKGDFTVALGQATYDVSYSILLTNITMSSELKIEDFKWKLVCTSCSTTANDATGDFDGLTTTEITLNSGLSLAPNSSESYALYVYLAESGEDQLSLLNKNFSAKVKATAEYVIPNN